MRRAGALLLVALAALVVMGILVVGAPPVCGQVAPTGGLKEPDAATLKCVNGNDSCDNMF